jgi:hypothetical protein
VEETLQELGVETGGPVKPEVADLGSGVQVGVDGGCLGEPTDEGEGEVIGRVQ